MKGWLVGRVVSDPADEQHADGGDQPEPSPPVRPAPGKPSGRDRHGAGRAQERRAPDATPQLPGRRFRQQADDSKADQHPSGALQQAE